MIRPFKPEDLELIKLNEWSNGDFHGAVIDERYEKYTLDDNGVKAIIFFMNVNSRDWGGFFLLSKDFSPAHGKIVKRFIADTVNKYKPERLWTVSQRNKTISRWHEFLGMSIEQEQEIDGKLYDVWSIKWGGKQHYS